MSLYTIDNTSFIIHKNQTTMDNKEILLTFDDGPNICSHATKELLEVLWKYKLKACFCVIGKFVEQSLDIVRMIYDQGHIIANHSFEHKFPLGKSYEYLVSDIKRTDQAIGSALAIENYKSTFYRPPFGITTKFLNEIIKDFDYTVLKVTAFSPLIVDSEYSYKKSDGIFHYLTRKIKSQNGGIIALHDGSSRLLTKNFVAGSNLDRSWIPDLVERLILHFNANGYTFKNLSIAAT